LTILSAQPAGPFVIERWPGGGRKIGGRRRRKRAVHLSAGDSEPSRANTTGINQKKKGEGGKEKEGRRKRSPHSFSISWPALPTTMETRPRSRGDKEKEGRGRKEKKEEGKGKKKRRLLSHPQHLMKFFNY